MKKWYYVDYWHDSSNTYRLIWLPAGFPAPETYERITRKEAIKLCIAERNRRRDRDRLAGYADAWIFPADLCTTQKNYIISNLYDNNPNHVTWTGYKVTAGYIIERK